MDKLDTLKNLIGGSLVGFSATLAAKTIIEENLQLHKTLNLPKSMVSIPLSLLQVWGLIKINPFSDSKAYHFAGSFAAIFAMLILQEVTLDHEGITDDITAIENGLVESLWGGERYPSDVNKFLIVDNQVYWRNKPISLDMLYTIKRCLDVKGLPAPVFQISGNPNAQFLQEISRLLAVAI